MGYLVLYEQPCLEIQEESKRAFASFLANKYFNAEWSVLVCKNPSTIDVCDNHFEIFSNSNNDDDITIDDTAFEDIEYVEASLSDHEIVSVEEENVVQQEEEEVDFEDISQIQDNDIPDNSSNDPLLEEVDLFLFDNSITPGIENVADDPEGDIYFLEELLINDSILSYESSDSNFEDNPSN
nr:hypothetical protein [Tanacetum cinerariifolium]